MRIVSIGTCLTHEIFFDATNHGLRPRFRGLDYYSYQRTSLISLTAPPVTADPVWLSVAGETSEVQWIREDFEKTFWDRHAAMADYVLLDFLSERHPLYIAKADPALMKHFCILSAQNGAIPHDEYVAVTPPTAGDPAVGEYFHLWVLAFHAFLARLRAVNPACSVIVHDFRFAPAEDFPDDPVYAYLPLFEAMTAVVRRAVPALTVLRSRVSAVADPDHVWGHNPFHLTDAYYADLADQIVALIGL